MNQVSKQNAQTSVEKDFNELMTNSNLACDCRDKLDNCTFATLNDNLDEVSYLKNPFDHSHKYNHNPFNPEVREFVSCLLLEKEI